MGWGSICLTAKLMLKAIEQLGKQVKRANRELRFLRIRLGRLIRDFRRKTEGDADLEAAFAGPLAKAMQVRAQRQNRRGWKLSWHAPETECIGPFDKLRRQGSQALRVRREGPDRDHQPLGQGRPVRAARQGIARQSL